ncbi:HD-GYP domain-containing protein [Desulfitobacterium dichloroeliminans LMG P-21439]|uniref:HD-GYP domain-containing protein n=1 Tax=Desulfitobacterium dichloroeliminans (strain LMG P-21439 / DCA1) TaxID=871963 RepID=L0FCY9_DESDL|nr:HD domain-containing phosphohydrolase [Desulfitobacterium dichloroeliminans]AGA70501.1 HD-GYP domain-containing protein [Desulfitobacterium dichloroeliminans LMG P-21439]
MRSEALYIRRMWNFSKALDLALVDEEIVIGQNLPIGMRHGERVGYMCLRIGLTLGMSHNELVRLLIAGLMHDIGAVGGFHKFHGIPYWMKEHALLGAEIIKRFPEGEILSEAILHHHEAPHRNYAALKADPSQVSLVAKIISFADKVDVNLSRKVLNREERGKLIQWVKEHEGRSLYAEVVPPFLKLVKTEAFWLDLEHQDLLQVSLDLLFDQWDIWSTSRIDDKQTYILAKTFARLIDQKSAFTACHSQDVASNVERLAIGIGWDKKACKAIRIAGLLHDLGKLSVPKKILDKPGPLESHEVEVIRTHTYYTYHLLAGAGFPHHVIQWAAFHHERLDGQGYPFGISEEKLNTGARLMTIADMFTALTEDRPYREALSAEKALEIIGRGVGTSVDSNLMERARKILL